VTRWDVPSNLFFTQKPQGARVELIVIVHLEFIHREFLQLFCQGTRGHAIQVFLIIGIRKILSAYHFQFRANIAEGIETDAAGDPKRERPDTRL
jgi:hypothetical protein